MLSKCTLLMRMKHSRYVRLRYHEEGLPHKPASAMSHQISSPHIATTTGGVALGRVVPGGPPLVQSVAPPHCPPLPGQSPRWAGTGRESHPGRHAIRHCCPVEMPPAGGGDGRVRGGSQKYQL
jgi:hypothetical protein